MPRYRCIPEHRVQTPALLRLYTERPKPGKPFATFAGGHMEHPAPEEVGIPRHEIDRRLARVRQRMADRGLELLIVFSSPGNLRFGQRGHVLYLSGYEPYFGDCMMLLPLDPSIDAVLVKDAANYFPQACTWITGREGAA
jgi:hypothetical protein